MNNTDLANSYNKIADKWDAQMEGSAYGLPMVDRAVEYCLNKARALDVGCGSGGRIIDRLLAEGFELEALDISSSMLELARAKHPEVVFQQADICDWETDQVYDLIVAWDSIFHLPVKSQGPTLAKLCGLLKPKGILLYTCGDVVGEHFDNWHGEVFRYGSVGIAENLRIIEDCGCVCKHLELDQFPEKHVCVIVEKK